MKYNIIRVKPILNYMYHQTPEVDRMTTQKERIESSRINFWVLVFKLTKSERAFNRAERLIDLKTQRLQHQVTNSRWEKVKLKNDLDSIKSR